MSPDQSKTIEPLAAAQLGTDVTVKLGKTLDGKFKVLTVLETDVDSYTLEALRVLDECAVVVRLLKPEASSQKVIKERFSREANKLKLLVHHNVPRCIELAFTELGQPYAVLTHFRGESLRQILSEESSLPVERVIHVVSQICAALTAAHKLGIVEHNLSPRSIYLSKSENGLDVVKMPGVGFVETLPAFGNTFINATQDLSQSDTFVYKSPEGCLGKDLDERSTVYSIGCLLYQLLTGSVPFLGHTALETGNRHLKETALLLEDVRPDLRFPAVMQEIVSKALEKEPSERYLNILELQRALKSAEVREIPLPLLRPRSVRRDFKKTLPGHVSGQWKLINSTRSEVRKVSPSVKLEEQIIWMCVLGVFAVLAIVHAGDFLWVWLLLGATMVRLVMHIVAPPKHLLFDSAKQSNEPKLPESKAKQRD